MQEPLTMLIAAAFALSTVTLHAQAPSARITVPAGAQLILTTAKDLTSKNSVKGDQVDLLVAEDVYVSGVLAIAKGSAAVGKIAMAQDKGAFGQSGKLLIEPLYVKIGNETLRLTGSYADKGTITAAGVAGLVILTPGISGRSAKIASGTAFPAMVLFEKTILLTPSVP